MNRHQNPSVERFLPAFSMENGGICAGSTAGLGWQFTCECEALGKFMQER